MPKLVLLIIAICFSIGCAYTAQGQNKATYELMMEKKRSLELDNQIKAEQLKQLQLQTARLEAKAEGS